MKAIIDDGGSLMPFVLLVENMKICFQSLFNYITLILG